MAGRKAKVMTHPLFIVSAPKAHYPLFNLVEKTAYPRRQKPCRSPSPKAKNDQFKRQPHPSPSWVRSREERDAGEIEEVVSGGTWVPVDETIYEGLPVEFGEICEEDEFFDDELSLGVDFPTEEIDMSRFCFDDDIGCNTRYLNGCAATGGLLKSRSNLARTAAEIMVALQKTEEEIRKLEQIALAEGTRLSRQGSLTRGWVESPKAAAGIGAGEESGFFTPTTPDSSFDSPVEAAASGKEDNWEEMNASLAQLIHQERMLPGRTVGAKDKKLQFKNNSVSEGEEMVVMRPAMPSARRAFYSVDDVDVPRRRRSDEFLFEREKAVRASNMGASPDNRTTASTPSRPSFTLDESSSGRLFSVEKLNARFSTDSSSPGWALQETDFRSLGKDTRRRPVVDAPTLFHDAVPVPSARANCKQASSEGGGCKCFQDKPPGAVRHGRRSNLETSKSLREESNRVASTPIPDKQRRSDHNESSGTGSKGGRRLSLPARPGAVAEKMNGTCPDSTFRHERDTLAHSGIDGAAFRGSLTDSPPRHDGSLRREKQMLPLGGRDAGAAAAGGSESPFGNDKPEPLQVKLAAPHSPLRSEPYASPGRFSLSSRCRDTSGPGASPMRSSRTRTRVKLRLVSPFQLLRKLKEVCTRLILAASSSVKPDHGGVVEPWNSVPSRPSTSSSCSFSSVAATPARVSSSQTASSPRISHRRSSAGNKPSRGSPHVSSPAVNRHSFYSEAISDCIEFIKRSSTPDTRIM